MRPYFIMLLLALLAACSKPVVKQEPVPEKPSVPEPQTQAPREDNPYALSYVARQLHGVRLGPGPAEPDIYQGRKEVEDYQRMLDDGYVMLGYSSFEAGSVPPSRALAQAAKAAAGAVIVYEKPISAPVAVNGQSAGEPVVGADNAGNGRRYSYFATYWGKLMPPVFGVHVMQRNEKSPESGLTVLAVITGSPAAQAGVAVGDNLLNLAGEVLSSAQELQEVSQRYAGQEVLLVLRRVQDTKRFSVKLSAAE